METYDMKPDAPREYRGQFSPIATRIPGMDVCELLPQHCQLADAAQGRRFQSAAALADDALAGFGHVNGQLLAATARKEVFRYRTHIWDCR